MENWYKHTEKGVLFTQRKTCPITTLATTNVTWTSLVLNRAPAVRGSELPIVLLKGYISILFSFKHRNN